MASLPESQCTCPNSMTDGICAECTIRRLEWKQVRDGTWIELRESDGSTVQIFAGSGHAAQALVTTHNAALRVLKFPQDSVPVKSS